MWCGKCQADVAAEVSPDNQRVFCTACGTLLSTIDAPPTRPASDRVAADKTKDARELLQRWSTAKVVDPFGPPMQKRELAELPPLPSSPKTVAQPTPVTQQIPSIAQPVVIARSAGSSPASDGSAKDGNDNDSQANSLCAEESANPSPPPLEIPSFSTPAAEVPVTRDTNQLIASPVIDVSAANAIPVESSLPAATASASAAGRGQAQTPTIRVDAAHPPDHFIGAPTAMPRNQSAAGPFVHKTVAAEPSREIHRPLLRFPSWDAAVWRTEPSAAGSWSSAAGQFLAYLGVLVLTAGTCLVVWSYYGGPANYAPTGWLVATAGQMLLFFGIVTLVSGGLEQTTEQVNKRIEQLGDHIIRIEQTAREMNQRGAVPPPHFGEHSDAVFSSVHERAVVEK